MSATLLCPDVSAWLRTTSSWRALRASAAVANLPPASWQSNGLCAAVCRLLSSITGRGQRRLRRRGPVLSWPESIVRHSWQRTRKQPIFVSQWQPSGGLKRLPRSAGWTAPTKSINSDLSPVLCGTSILPGSSPGKALQILASRHLLTELSQALTMAAGESNPKTHELPRSSTALLAEGMDHPNLCRVAKRAVTGPAATDHHGHFTFPSLKAASTNVSWSCSEVNHFSDHASAQYCT